jgi:hypothetical protein
MIGQRFISLVKVLCLLSVATLQLASCAVPRSPQSGSRVLAFLERELLLTEKAKEVFWNHKWEMSQVIDKPISSKKVKGLFTCGLCCCWCAV